MRIRPTRKRESPKARREREAYEAAMEQQSQYPGAVAHVPAIVDPTPNVSYGGDEVATGPLPPSPFDLDDSKLARRSDVETSHQAVPNADRRRTQLAAILTLYNADPRGLTADECSVLLGDDVWRRVSDLRTLGHLAWKLDDEGRPVTRTARSGRQARVLVRVMEAL